MNAYILAGGKGTRIRTCKAFIKFKDRFLIDIITDKLYKYFSKNIYIIIKAEMKKMFKNYENLVIEERDIYSSLIGIYTALSHTTEEWNFIIGVDMPGINIELIKVMESYKQDNDIVVPFVGGYPEPLFGLYNKKILPYIEDQIETGDLKIQRLYKKVKTVYIKERVIKRYDPLLKSFININTWDDYKKALKIL